MKQMIMVNEEHNGANFTVFSIPVLKVRKMAAIRTATRVIRPAKGGGYRRKERFDKGLTTYVE